ncbi:MAG: 4-phosphopantetheinyl transferase [Acidobacteriota bacterium]|nr:4-phosphopantetheinyl transferase [Acidobacteriota bacterium]
MLDSPPPTIASPTAPLWFLDTAAFAEPSATQPWLARLAPHERRRYAAYQNAEARRDYLGTRALVRTALAHATGLPAERLRFGADPRARPELIEPPVAGLSISLANTNQLAVGLFALDRAVGVDVELVAPIAAVGLAECFFSPREAAELSALAEDASLTRFYELWTLREAYLKARGVGLTLPLDQLAFRPTPSGTAQAEFGPAIRDDPDRWQFGLTWITQRHLAATCIERPSSGASTRIALFDAGPAVAEAARPPLD